MGADYSDMIAKLQMALAQQQNQGPSLFGLQSQTDPNQTAAVLKQMQNQQVVNQAGTEGTGQYAYLHNAGQKDFARAGLGLGNLLGLGQPAQQDNSQVSDQRAALQQGKQEFAQATAQGMDPNQAQILVLTHLAQAGVPGAADKLEAAQTAMLKNAATVAETKKNNNQADSYVANAANQADEAKNRAFQQGSGTWQTSYTDPQGFYMLQKNANGEVRRVELKPTAPAAQAPTDPSTLAGSAADVANYKIPENQIYGRGMTAAQKAAFHDQVVAINPNYDQRNFKQSNDAIQAYGPKGTLGQQTLKLQNAINHLGLLDEYGKALDNSDVKGANVIANKLSQEFGGVPISGYNAIAPIVASEVSGALVKGGGGVEERAEKARELGSQLSTPARSAATQGMRDLLSAQYKNYQNNYEKTTRRKDFQDMFPIAGGFSGAAPETPAAAAPASSGWGTAVAK